MTADPRLVPDCAVLDEGDLSRGGGWPTTGPGAASANARAAYRKQIRCGAEQFAPQKPGTKIVPRIAAPVGARAVTSMANVALISIEPANSVLNGAQVMGRALDGWESQRRGFPCPAPATPELLLPGPRGRAGAGYRELEASLALELAHGYLRPIEVDEEVGLLAVVGEGMRGTPGLAGRILPPFRAKRQHHRIAQGSTS